MSEPSANTAGGRVVGRYVLYDELASGGMATVHIGRLVGEVGFSRSVAIKRLHPQFARDPEFATMFMEEARIAARIRHPNVVPVIDVVSEADELFLVMDYIQGETITRLTRVSRSRHRIVPMPIALAIAADALAGLHAAHEAKDEYGRPLDIVHRDISPHNIIVGNDGVSRVLDFGIAKASSSSQSTRDGEVKGKFAYMSPEQLSSAPVDRRADIFALSIVLWEMLTGQRLFAAGDPAGIVGKVLHGAIEPPSRIAAGLPAAVDALVMIGLTRDASRRFKTAAEMARQIEAMGLPIARPNEVGAWVNRIAGDTLKRRATRIAEIESTGSFSRATSTPLIAPFSNANLPHADSTGSQSGVSGWRTREDVPAQSAPSMPAVASAPLIESIDEPPRRSRAPIYVIGILALIASAAGVFVWQSGGLSPARERVLRVVHRAEGDRAASASGASNKTAASAVASSTASNANAAIDAPLFDLDGKPSLRYHARHGGGASGTVAGAGEIVSGGAIDPKLQTRVPGAAGGGNGDLGEAIKGAAGSGAGFDQNGGAEGAGRSTGNVPQRPSQGQVQAALGAMMSRVRACFVHGDPISRATITFQSDGSVQRVNVTGFAQGQPQEACVKNILSAANVSPFADATYVIPITITP